VSTVPGYHTNTINDGKEPEAGSIGAIGKVKMKSLHPSQPLCKKYGMVYDCKYLDRLEIVCGDKGKVFRKGCIADRYIVRHPDFGEEEFMVARQMFTILQEGETPFNNKVVVPILPPMDTEPTVEEQAPAQPIVELRPPQGRGLLREEISNLQSQGYKVDDNNKLVVDNQGDPDPPPTGMTWMKPSFCPRRSQCHLKMKEK
jgi:hypothetical protein